MPEEHAKPVGSGTTLVVVVHGLGVLPHRMEDVRAAACEAYGPGTVVRVPEMPYARWLSGTRATRIVADLLSEIDRWVQEAAPTRIVLVGHSVGATIARRTFLVAAGCPDDFRAEGDLATEKPRAWADKVERVVMLAAFNRGWKISARMGWIYSILFNIVGLVGHLVPGWTPTAFDFRIGAPFMAQTRLNWLAYRRSQQASHPRDPARPDQPILIQLLGTQDDLVSPVDQVDLTVDGTGQALIAGPNDPPDPGPEAQDYFLIELPFTDHKQAVILEGDAAAQARRVLVLDALKRGRVGLSTIALDPALLSDEIEGVDETVRDTVFVIHGIRDDGFWTHRIAERVRAAGSPTGRNQATVFRSWTPSYGYFAMLPFVLPWIRREKVEWFMDQYVTAFAQYPKSDFHYVGHSNGTYLAARALQDYPALHFRNVLFAGSVVRRDYPWLPLVDSGRVARFQNVCAGGDWVVALLPKSVEWFRKFDLGGAGFDGFRDAGKRPAITEFKYLRGGHGAGIAEPHWPKIAAFIVDGTPFAPDRNDPETLYEPTPDPSIAALGKAHIGIAAVLGIGLLVVWLCFKLGGLFGLLLAVLLIRFVVLRV
ncbi:hypothetical protein [uncultured Methylobacterium sp.]|uniref:hypothetical protein n=1 Tax=uncultured Methylobacterium sp. TaxID=157278 RepID=UPI0035CC194C